MDVIGIEFMDIQGRVIRKTEAIIDGQVYAPIIRTLPNSIFEDRDFDGQCMFSIAFVETLIKLRKLFNRDIYTGAKL